MDGLGTRCFESPTTAHSWTFNRMSYTGGGTLSYSCVHLGTKDGAVEVGGSGCYPSVNTAQVCQNPVQPTVFWFASVDQLSPANHTIYGYANTAGCF